MLVDVDADDVSEKLEHLHAYPLDLDAAGHGLSDRYESAAWANSAVTERN